MLGVKPVQPVGVSYRLEGGPASAQTLDASLCSGVCCTVDVVLPSCSVPTLPLSSRTSGMQTVGCGAMVGSPPQKQEL